jgi:hypothetical protein
LVNAQNKYCGKYSSYHGDLIIDSNSTFEYSKPMGCLVRSCIYGNWTLKNDTIYFIKVPIFDTVQFEKSNNIYFDSLVVSLDRKTERISMEQFTMYSKITGGQDTSLNIEKLFYKKEKLYEIKPNGRIITKKIRMQFKKPNSLRMYFYLLKQKKKFVPWYTKQKN